LRKEAVACYITGSRDQELLRRNQYLLAEDRMLRNQIRGRLHLSDEQRRSLAEIGKGLGRIALAQVAKGCCKSQPLFSTRPKKPWSDVSLFLVIFFLPFST